MRRLIPARVRAFAWRLHEDRRLLGIASLVVVALLLLVAFNASKLPFANSGTTYHAALADADGLQPGDVVRVAGVKVGEVKSLHVRDGHVDVAFTVSSVRLGTATRVVVKVETMLGQQSLDVEPRGDGALAAGATIPLAHTTPAYTLQDAVTGLTHEGEQLDLAELTKSLNVMAGTLRDASPQVRSALDGLSTLSRTLADRDTQLSALLKHAHGVAAAVAGRDAQLKTLIRDSALLLQTLDDRRQVVHQLLRSTTALSQQLTGLVRDNQASLRPALQHLTHVTQILNANAANLDSSLKLEAVFVRYFTNLVGNGRWMDSYAANMVDASHSGGTP